MSKAERVKGADVVESIIYEECAKMGVGITSIDWFDHHPRNRSEADVSDLKVNVYIGDNACLVCVAEAVLHDLSTAEGNELPRARADIFEQLLKCVH